MNPDPSFPDALLEALPPSFERVLSASVDLPGTFVELASRFADEIGTVALLSGGAHDSARWNVLGIRPWLVLAENAGRVILEAEGKRTTLPGDPFEALEIVSNRYALPGLDVDHPLSAGLLGYLAYDLKDVLEVLPRTSRDDLGLPRLWMAAPSILVVQDRRDGATTSRRPWKRVWWK